MLYATCDQKSDGWKLVVKADGKDLATQTVAKATMQDGWTEIKATLAEFAGKKAAVEITMEPVTPPAEKKGPPALSITVPEVR